METCSVCEGKSGSVVVVTGTSVSEVSDSSCGGMKIWDCSLVICLCLAPHLPADASCTKIRRAELDVLHSHFNRTATMQMNYDRL